MFSILGIKILLRDHFTFARIFGCTQPQFRFEANMIPRCAPIRVSSPGSRLQFLSNERALYPISALFLKSSKASFLKPI
jgi:hypothetical protein